MSERYRVSKRTEHACCWGASVEDTAHPTIINGEHYNDEYRMVCECDNEAMALSLIHI